jgi:hypothetical protein
MRIVYLARRDFGDWYLAHPYISIFVLDPPIGADPRGTGEPAQHIYRLGHHPDFPALCVYDPVEDGWLPSEPIVQRIIPWTIKWLFFHEEWLLSDEWKGGGRHPEMAPPCLTEGDSESGRPALRARFLNDEFHRLGRRIGTFASCRLMEAASAGSFPPWSWRSLSGVTPADVQSELTSILLRVPQLAVFLPLGSVQVFPPPKCATSTSIEETKSFHPSQSLLSAA